MRTSYFSLILIAALALPLVASAASPSRGNLESPSATAKIGYVDFNRALNEVVDGKKAKQRLKDEFREKQQQLDRLQSQLAEAKDAIDGDRVLLSSEELQKREAEYRRKYTELQQKLDGFKTEISAKESELTQEILNRLRSIVRELGIDDGYDLILEKSQDVVLFAPRGNDLTDRVIASYDHGRSNKKK